MRALGATVVEEGRDYDEAVGVMQRIAANEGRVIAHSTNDPRIVAGAGTMTLEILEQEPRPRRARDRRRAAGRRPSAR